MLFGTAFVGRLNRRIFSFSTKLYRKGQSHMTDNRSKAMQIGSPRLLNKNVTHLFIILNYFEVSKLDY
jgi:hypothetical protein